MNHVAIRPRLDILSICTGGAGLDLGVELAIRGARTVCMVEREAFAVAHLVAAMQQGLLAECPVWSDARTFDGRRWRGCVDGLIGGIPCQPHSLAGKRLGRGDERDLWSTARRIIVQSGAWFVLIENVRGMVSSGGAERVWRDLSRLGFASEGGLFTASEVGASHERERFFILAVADGRGERAEAGIPAAPGWHGVGTEPAIADHGGDAVVDAARHGRGEGRPEPEFRRGRHSAASTDGAMGDAPGQGLHATALAGADRSDEGIGPRHAKPERRGSDVGTRPLADAASQGWRSEWPECGPEQGGRSGEARRLQSGRLGGQVSPAMGDAPGGDGARTWQSQAHHAEAREWQHRRPDGGLFPPGPGDIDGWRAALERAPELEPAFRRVADGLASRLDIARVDRLRMLGNGVVSLEAAYAVRTLATRLAERGSPGATRLVRMMAEVS